MKHRETSRRRTASGGVDHERLEVASRQLLIALAALGVDNPGPMHERMEQFADDLTVIAARNDGSTAVVAELLRPLIRAAS